MLYNPISRDRCNINFMTVGRSGAGQEAIMAIGIDEEPSEGCLRDLLEVPGVVESMIFTEK